VPILSPSRRRPEVADIFSRVYPLHIHAPFISFHGYCTESSRSVVLALIL
jgi:hypothetical protein